MLQKLARHTESNFITTKAFRDRQTGKMRMNLVDGIHYNNLGIRTLAREIKKSLFSHSNLDTQTLDTLIRMEQTITSVTSNSTAK